MTFNFNCDRLKKIVSKGRSCPNMAKRPPILAFLYAKRWSLVILDHVKLITVIKLLLNFVERENIKINLRRETCIYGVE